MNREKLLAQYVKERDRQDKMWGLSFDSKNTPNDWATYVNWYLASATRNGATVDEQTEALFKAFCIMGAALETLERNGKFASRHYENT